MSGTRSPSPKAPATEAILVAHGQPSQPEAGEDELKALAAQIQLLLPDWTIRSATLAAPGALEAVLDTSEGAPFIYPMFMADGWFTKTALPGRLGDRKVHQLAPFGTHPGLPHQTLKLLKREADQLGWSFNSCDIMIAAHGSSSGPAAGDCALYFARRLRRLTPFKKAIHTGFLAQEPFLADMAWRSSSRTLMLPFLAGTGTHLTDDIPQAVEEGRFQGVLLPAIGSASFVPDLIAQSLKSARQRAMRFDPMDADRLAVSLSPPPPIRVSEPIRPGASDPGDTPVPTRRGPGKLRDVAAAIAWIFRSVISRVSGRISIDQSTRHGSHRKTGMANAHQS
ncbi:sirohydrochlorin chelatase [Roseibium sp.]|uniref:sirohydrochlorin chelatase n=1 Tax=Roseibium sp. TaxID=1936156 RepID=UPI003BB1217B